MKKILIAVTITLLVSQANAAIILFDLNGKGGTGLRTTNENTSINTTTYTATGGEVGAGIFFDDITKILTLNFGWGVGNGFVNLSGDATNAHIHGPTISGGVASFTENSSTVIHLFGLTGWNGNAANGGFFGTITLNPDQESALLADKTYINIHTSLNGSGEIRGNLVTVPEPSQTLLGFAGLVMLGARRKR